MKLSNFFEKIDKMDMGDVIKDFYKSDAPQFKGKSKEKRRQMAIAAKLSAESLLGEADITISEKCAFLNTSKTRCKFRPFSDPFCDDFKWFFKVKK